MGRRRRQRPAATAADARLACRLAAHRATALTNPDQLEIITAFRDAMLARNGQENWTKVGAGGGGGL